MKSQRLSDQDQAIWHQLVESQRAWGNAQRAFYADGVDRVALVRQGLHSQDVATAMTVASRLSLEERLQLFDEWVAWASQSHGYARTAREIIRSLPRDWVLAHIEAAAEPLLENGTYDEYRRLLELYSELDPILTLRLARRAAKRPDADIQEAGEDFLGRFNRREADEDRASV